MPQPRRRVHTADASLSARFDAVRREHEVPLTFSPAALAEAQEAAERRPGTAARWVPGDRRDLTDVDFVTLDPPGSTDLDQAMHLSRRPGGGYRIRYAIADVAAFVVPGGALDRETAERVETVYCPDTRVPLHPEVLSEGAASLLPGVDRLAVVWTLDLGSDGQVVQVDVGRATVRSRARLSYAEEHRRAADGAGPDDVVTLLAEIGTRRAALERERGGVSLGRPEQDVVDLPGGGWALAFRAALPIEDHNAQISLMTGMAAARLMLEGGVGVLRTMPAADDRALGRLRRQALALGVPWEQDQRYGDVLASVDHSRPETAAFLAAATTLFRGAAWTPFRAEPPAETGHGAIGAPYAHVTAPLRRLVDRFGLETCLAVHEGRAVPEWVLAALPALGERMAAGVRRGNAVDRACTDVVEAAVLRGHVGEVYDAVALDDRTVQIRRPAVVARIDDEHLVAGETLRVRLVDADVEKAAVLFRREV